MVYNKSTKKKGDRKMTIQARVEGIIDTITYPITHLKFTYKTKVLPRFVPHHRCIFYDWVHKTYKEGWYIRNKNGYMIPWVHFDNGCLIAI